MSHDMTDLYAVYGVLHVGRLVLHRLLLRPCQEGVEGLYQLR